LSHAVASASRLPVLGALSPIARIAVLATVLVAIAAIVMDFGLHIEGTVVFIVAAVAILGLAWVVGLSTERLGALLALDGESNWLEGALLTIVYIVLAISFFELR
jgi:Ca2+/H+ antiporter